MKLHYFLSALVLALLASACGDDGDAEGTIVVTAYGEEFVEEGLTTDDGWDVQFDRFDVSFGGVSIADAIVTAATTVDVAVPSAGQGHEIGRVTVPTGTYDDARFTITRVAIKGRAQKDGVEKRFALAFDDAVSYSLCETSTRVRKGAEARFEITIHADHLFFDSRASAEPNLLFQALADADADDDDVITEDELEAAGLGAYDPGSDGADIDNLWDYLERLITEIGHADGEAHCVATRIVD